MSSSTTTTRTQPPNATATETLAAEGGQPAPDNAPYWMTGPCPAWCTQEHHGSDMGSDRACWSDRNAFTLVTEGPCETETREYEAAGPRPVAEWEVWTADACAWLLQEYRESEPRVGLEVTQQIDTRLALGEADALVQLLGRLEVTAGDTGTPGHPAERVPWWQTAPCPAWCQLRGGHGGLDDPDDRVHQMTAGIVTLTTEAAPCDAGPPLIWQPAELAAGLVQGYRETGPRIFLTLNGQADAHLTPGEARELRELLVGLLDAAIRAQR
jgi:hypothetical protein